jgi:pimeloyl-ACP methyl ester carboxylesterase
VLSELRATLAALIAFALLLLGLAALVIYFGQRSLIFPGSRAVRDLQPEAFGGERIWLGADGARTEAWLLPARGAAAGGPLLVYAHGNGELIDHWLEAFEPARELGAAALLVEYPGYGRSRGSPSEHSIQAAMVAAYDFATKERGYAEQAVVGWGRSVGGGAVCALARERRLAALVLESTFTSVTQMALLHGLPARFAPLLVRDPLDNLGLVRRFRGPVLVLHGERDEMIPPDHARELHAGARSAELHWLPCGHNDCERPWVPVLAFLERHGLLARTTRP